VRFLRVSPDAKKGSDFSDVVDQFRDPSILTSHIVGNKPQVQTKSYEYIHISQIDSVCPREYVIGALTKSSRQEVTSFPLRIVFNMGSALHWWIQNHPEVYFGEDKVLGYWYCAACGNTIVLLVEILGGSGRSLKIPASFVGQMLGRLFIRSTALGCQKKGLLEAWT